MADEYKLKGVTSLALKPGDKQEVEVEGVDGAKVLLLNAGGNIQAIGPKCTHYGAPLVKGVLSTNGRLTCPWHGGATFLSAFLQKFCPCAPERIAARDGTG
jgi:nitrite reductase/ring-hydroxylating ferredoxin subunit